MSRSYAAAATGAVRSGTEIRGLYEARVRSIWAFVKRQPLSYWLVVLYMFFEYVRPQQIYSSLSGTPFAFWTIILCTIAMLIEGRWTRKLTAADALLAAFTAVVLLSSALAFQPSAAFGKLSVYLSWVWIYLLITAIVNTKARFLIFMLAYLLFCFKMSQHGFRSWAQGGFGFRDWGATCAPGWFHNSGECGIQMSMFFPPALFFVLALRRYWSRWKLLFFGFMPFTAVITIVASSSRGALLGLAGIGIWLWTQTRRKMLSLVTVAVLAAGVIAIIPDEQMARLSAMGEDETSESRLTYWEHGLEIMRDHPVLGIGYANWLPYYRTHYGARGQLPHNMFIEAGSELGYTGLLVFILMIGCTFYLNRRTRAVAKRLGDGEFLSAMARGLDGALIGLIITGSFVTVLYYPFFWINLAMTVALHNTTCNELNAARRGRAPRRVPVVAGPGAPVSGMQSATRYGT